MAFPHLPCTLSTNTQYPHPISHRFSHSTPPSSTVTSLTLADLFDRKPLELPPRGSALSLAGGVGPDMLSFVTLPVAEIRRRNLLQLITAQGKTPQLLTDNPSPLPALPNRPPPEPPPLAMASWAENSSTFPSATNRNSIPCFRKPENPPLTLSPIRPPHKPTWIESRSSVKAFNFGDFDRLLIGALWLQIWSECFNCFWFCVVSLVIMGLLINLLVSKFRAGILIVINKFSSPSHSQAGSILVVCLDHRETMYSRSARISAKEMIRNWIESNTLDSPSFMAIYLGQMLFEWLVGLAIWVDVIPLVAYIVLAL